MRTIRRTTAFKRDYKHEKKGRFPKTLDTDLVKLVSDLATDAALDPRHRDHPLSGRWKNHRDSHLRPDLVLIYRKPDDDHLDLVRLGSHSKLGL